MDIVIRKAVYADIDSLVNIRLEVLQAANKLDENEDLSVVQQYTRAYYQQNLTSDNHIEYLAYTGKTFVGCGAASIYQVMPTYHNPLGKKAYVMNMYTRKEFRQNGIAGRILKQLILDIQCMGVLQIQLEATREGRPLYEKFGFIAMDAEMELNVD